MLSLKSKKKISDAMGGEDLIFLGLILYMFLIEIVSGYNFSARNFQPIIFCYLYYFLYRGYSHQLPHHDLQKFLIKSTAVWIIFITLIHLLGYMGFVPHFKRMDLIDTALSRMLSFQRVDTVLINETSYYIALLIYILVFFKDILSMNKYIYLSSFALANIVLILNQTRGAFLCVGLLYIYKLLLSGWKKAVITIICMIGLLSFAIGLYSIADTYDSNSAIRILNLMDSSGMERLNLYFFSFEEILKNPILGKGAYLERKTRLGGYVVHSFILRQIISYGIPAFIVFMIGFLKLGKPMHNQAFFGGLIVIFFTGMFDPYIYYWYFIIPMMYSYRCSDNVSYKNAIKLSDKLSSSQEIRV